MNPNWVLEQTFYYFLLHPSLVEECVQDYASRDAESFPSSVQHDAPKETKEENQKKKTTTSNSGRRVSFYDLSEEKQNTLS